MPNYRRTCKVCGKVYDYCISHVPVPFRWQDVACCYDHGQIYLQQILDQKKSEEESAAEPVAETVEAEALAVENAAPAKAAAAKKKASKKVQASKPAETDEDAPADEANKE